jgi:hypothetical protein
MMRAQAIDPHVTSTLIRTSRVLAYCVILNSFLLTAYKRSIYLYGISPIETEQARSDKGSQQGRTSFTAKSQRNSPARLFISDRTVSLDPNTSRPWLSDLTLPQPPYKLILTDIGWNHQNRTLGLQFSRFKRSRELLQGMLDHPYFDPTIQWSQVVNGTQTLDTNTSRYYVFLDVETCFESNYPFYGGGTSANSDLEGGRIETPLSQHPCFNVINCHYIYTAMDTIYKFPKATLVVYNCRGNGPGPEFRKERLMTKQLSLVSESTK